MFISVNIIDLMNIGKSQLPYIRLFQRQLIPTTQKSQKNKNYLPCGGDDDLRIESGIAGPVEALI